MDKILNLSQHKSEVLTDKLALELKTITLMTKLYCQAHHQKVNCIDCQSLISHAEQKLDRCVYGQDKPACQHCPIHCYKPFYREKTKYIMRYSGPKMLFKHPILAIKNIRRRKLKQWLRTQCVSNIRLSKQNKMHCS